MAATPILFCSHAVEWGGAETVLADLLAALDRTRFTPHLACPGPGPLPARAAQLGASVHFLPIGGRTPLGKALSLPAAARGLRRIARSIGARLLYANTMIAGYAAVLAQRGDLPCLWHLHIVPGSRVAQILLRRAAAVVAPSAASAQGIGGGFAASARCHVVRNGVAAHFFRGAGEGLRAHLGLDADTPLVGIAARIDPHKGHAVLLQAAALSRGANAFHVAVLGGEAFAGSLARVSGHTDTLRQLAADLGIAARVHFLGHRDDLASLLPQLCAVVVPSTQPESAPRAIAEAQAAGCAVIASDIGGVGELIQDGTTGLLVPAGSAAALAAAIGRVLGDADLRRRLAAAGRTHAAANYSVEQFARRIETVCEQVLRQAR